jgi:hypothetical protein
MPVTLQLHVVVMSQTMIMIEIRRDAAVVTIAAEAEDEETTIVNAVLPAVDAARLPRQGPTVLAVNG